MALRTVRLLAPIATGATPNPLLTQTVNGRTYSVAANSYLDVPAMDADLLAANGWLRVGTFSGPTTSRPLLSDPDMRGLTMRGLTYFDATLGYVLTFDGANWRRPDTGA